MGVGGGRLRRATRAHIVTIVFRALQGTLGCRGILELRGRVGLLTVYVYAYEER